METESKILLRNRTFKEMECLPVEQSKKMKMYI